MGFAPKKLNRILFHSQQQAKTILPNAFLTGIDPAEYDHFVSLPNLYQTLMTENGAVPKLDSKVTAQR